MKPTSPRSRIAAIVVCAILGGGLLAACSADRGPTQEPSTVACSRPDSQDSKATDYLGLTAAQARARAAGQRKRVDVIGQDGTCQRSRDLNLNTMRVQVYLEQGKVTWSNIG